MINSDKLKEMKDTLGHGYPLILKDKLTEKGIFNSKGLPITANYIRQLFIGRVHNIDILNIIIDDYKKQKRKVTNSIKKLQKV